MATRQSVVLFDSMSPVSVSVAVVSDTGVVEALLLVASDNNEEHSSLVVLQIDPGIILGALDTGFGIRGAAAAGC